MVCETIIVMQLDIVFTALKLLLGCCTYFLIHQTFVHPPSKECGIVLYVSHLVVALYCCLM